MPRIYTSANDALDFCRRCFPAEKAATEKYGNLGDGPDGRGNCFGWDAEHPPYWETPYRCCTCNKPLSDQDDYAEGGE